MGIKPYRHVSALIIDQERTSILLKRFHEGWDLPWGTAKKGESDEDVLKRVVLQETRRVDATKDPKPTTGAGLQIEVIRRVGPDYNLWESAGIPREQSTLVMYECRILGGSIHTAQVAFVKASQARKQNIIYELAVPATNRMEIVCRHEWIIPLWSCWGTSRLTTRARMVWDGFSILEVPTIEVRHKTDAIKRDITLSSDKQYLIEEAETERRIWRRLDPRTKSGFMEKEWPVSD